MFHLSILGSQEGKQILMRAAQIKGIGEGLFGDDNLILAWVLFCGNGYDF